MSKWDVFVSYSRRDSEIVDRYARYLSESGLKVWLDVESRPGGPVSLPIFMTHGLLESRILCLFFSENSRNSQWVQQEFSTFAKRPWGFWSAQFKPVFLILQTPGFDARFDECLSMYEWRPFRQMPIEIGTCQLMDTDACRRELSDNLRKLVVTIEKEDKSSSQLKKNRLDTAQRFWNWTMPKTLQPTWQSADLSWILSQFDQMQPPKSQGEINSDGSHNAQEFFTDFINAQATGLTFSCLFAEALSAGLGNRYASINERLDDEWSKVDGVPRYSFVLSSGSPVDLLCSVAIDLSFAPQLLRAYYAARPFCLETQTSDPLDLTVLLSIGFMIHRWEGRLVKWKSLVSGLVDQQLCRD